jgi:hypothetical protein
MNKIKQDKVKILPILLILSKKVPVELGMFTGIPLFFYPNGMQLQ